MIVSFLYWWTQRYLYSRSTSAMGCKYYTICIHKCHFIKKNTIIKIVRISPTIKITPHVCGFIKFVINLKRIEKKNEMYTHEISTIKI